MAPAPSLRWPRSRSSPSACGEPARGSGSPAAAGAGGAEERSGGRPRTPGSLPCGGVGSGGGGLTMPRPCREHLEEEQLLDGRYRLQEVPGGRVALPVLAEQLSRLWLPQEMPCGLVWIQVGRDSPSLSAAMARRGLSPMCHIPPAGPHPLQGSPPADARPEAAG